jgi:hypothetical protein
MSVCAGKWSIWALEGHYGIAEFSMIVLALSS